MKYVVDEKEYEVKIIRKRNKNTYIRVKNEIIEVTTSYLVTNKQIIKILDSNKEFLRKNIDKNKKKNDLENKNFILGIEYDIIITNDIKGLDKKNHKIYARSKEQALKIISNETLTVFQKRLEYNYGLFDEIIPFPSLTIRKMKTRWGVCNRSKIRVTLNSELIKYSIEELDYVIIHELSHLVVFNHSKEFWNVVSKYCPNYKEIRRKLKD